MKKFNIAKIVTFLPMLLLIGLFCIPQITHAATLHDDLVSTSTSVKWVFEIWKVSLGLVNVFVVVILLFLAVVNIIHINYDTYAIKKSLPLLIGGIIAANFSLLICRMIVDTASILAITFIGDPDVMARNYLNAFRLGGDSMALVTSLLQAFPPAATSLLIVPIVVLFAVFIAILILSFLLWIRKFVILMLVMVSPVAFILYAFPPTQGLFKQWWSQFLKWVFMGPIVMFFMWVASKIGASNTSGTIDFALIFAMCLVTYLAAIVPFKLGGAIMGAWAGLGQKVTGTGKEGYLRKPVDKWIGDKKDAAKLRANNWMNKNTALGKWRAGHELEMETLKGENKAILEKRQADVRNKLGSKQQLRDAEIANSTSILEEEKTKQQLDIESGNFNHISKRQIQQITGKSDPMDVAQKYIEQANKLKQVQEGLEKRRSLDLNNLSIRDLREDHEFRMQLKSIGDEIESSDFDEDGNKMEVGSKPIKITYDRAIEVAEELRFKAKSETDLSKRSELIEAAKSYESKAKVFQNTHQNDTNGKKIDYNKYLSRNLSGRRQKVLNPGINDEAEVQVLSSTHTDLVDSTDGIDPNTGKLKTFGTSEWRGNSNDMDNGIRGEIHKSSATAAYATVVQMRAIKKVIDTAKHGDVEGLETMEMFCSRVEKARGTSFKADIALDALSKMDDKNSAQIISQVTPAGKSWATMTDQEKKKAISKINFSKLDVTSSGGGPEGKRASANRAFINRFISQIELDDKLGFSKSAGSILRKSK